MLKIDGKHNISNFCSRIAYNDSVLGIGKTFFCGSSPLYWRRGEIVFKRNSSVLESSLLASYWLPWCIYSEFKVEDFRVKQRLYVNSNRIFCTLELGDMPLDLTLEVVGESFGPSKAFCFKNKGLIIEEMSPEVKPLTTWIRLKPKPEKILVASKASEWKEKEFIWSENKIFYRMIFRRVPKRLILVHSSITTDGIFKSSSIKNAVSNKEVENKKSWQQYFMEVVPKFSCSSEKIEKLYYYAWYVQRANTLNLGGLLPHMFTTPSKEGYIGSWLYDTSFHAIIQKWLNDYSYAYGNLLSNIPRQTSWGCIQDAGREYGAVNVDGSWDHPLYYHKKGSGVGGPRLFAVSIWDTYQKFGDIKLLQTLYPHLLLFDRWLQETKMSSIDKDLIAAKNWYDIEWDNSKRWGKGARGGPKKTSGYKECDWDFPITPIDANVEFLLHLKAMSDISKTLGDDETCKKYLERSERTEKAIIRKMWDEKEGFFFDLAEDGRKIPVFTPAAFLPLTAGVPSRTQYEKMKQHLVNTGKFWLKFPIPTLSAEDPDFSPQDFWMGPTWISINYLIIEGLYQYDKPLADELLSKTINLMTHTGNPTCWEYYDPSTGQGLGAIDYGWCGLINDLILKRIMGIHPDLQKTVLDPNLPENWDYVSLSNLTLARSTLSIMYRKRKKLWSIKVKNLGKKHVNILIKGDRMIILKPKEGYRTQIRPLIKTSWRLP